MIAGLAAVILLAAEPSSQEIVFYNARIALREDRPADVVKLWLLRNSLTDRGERPRNDGDFRSAVWAAIGELGTCPDGFDRDEKAGAGVWPIAMHNWLLQEARRGPPPKIPPPFGVFEISRQQRKVSLHDVLSEPELDSFSLMRTACLAEYPWFLQSMQSPRVQLRDRRVAGRLMRRMLAASLDTLDRKKVPSIAPIEARMFDLDLALLELEKRHALRLGLQAQRRARVLGVSEAGAREVLEASRPLVPRQSAQGRLLRRTLDWSIDDWMSLSRSRRLFLFDRARDYAENDEMLDRLMIAMLDDRIAKQEGAEVEVWIGSYGAAKVPSRRDVLYLGDRGARLLELDPESGFRERAVLALHRGVAFLEAGSMDDALRSFAFALAHADESREDATTAALARRWLSYTLSRFETSQEVVAIVVALVPKQEYNAVIEDLVWRAALRADAKSFDRAVASTRRGGALDLQIARLRTLSRGKAGELATELRKAAETEPNLTLRFIGKLIERIETEDAAVRSANAPMMQQLVSVLDPLTVSEGGKKKSAARAAEQHLIRIHAILEGLRELDASSATDKARTHAPGRDTFAGAIRLAPADPLPWPFFEPEPEGPSPFTPLVLEPLEWKNEKGELVFGWRITDAAD